VIEFTCLHCQKVLRVKDAMAGRTGPCPRCRGTVKVPEGPAGEIQAAPPPPPVTPLPGWMNQPAGDPFGGLHPAVPSAELPPRRRGHGAAVAGVLLVLLVAGGAGAVMLWRDVRREFLGEPGQAPAATPPAAPVAPVVDPEAAARQAKAEEEKAQRESARPQAEEERRRKAEAERRRQAEAEAEAARIKLARQREQEEEERQDREAKAEFDLLSGEEQFFLNVYRNCLEKELFDPKQSLEDNRTLGPQVSRSGRLCTGNFIRDHWKFFNTDKVRGQMTKWGAAVGGKEFLKTLDLEKHPKANEVLIQFALLPYTVEAKRINRQETLPYDDRKGAILVAAQLAKGGIASLTDVEKEFVKAHRALFDPALKK
jgi:hypothetical protein